MYEEVMAAQIASWRALLPNIVRRLSKIRDIRNPNKIKHSVAVLMLYGLFLFVLRVKSRRDFNENLTGPGILNLLNSLFPEITSIPHADTIANFLESVDLEDLEKIHISMIRDLIKKKKFRKLLIMGKLPISIDGTQKMTRYDQLQEEGWQLRTISTKEGKKYQQFVYVVEANLTFANGVNIPIMTEYCYLSAEESLEESAKQDCETKAFYRLSDRLKKYFPRLEIMLLLDNLYASEGVIADIRGKRWEFMIKLPAKIKSLYGMLKEAHSNQLICGPVTYYRERAQSFFWVNDVIYRDHIVHLVLCNDQWSEVSRTTGDIITVRSQHTWISSIALSSDNVHTLCNLAARKRSFIGAPRKCHYASS